MSDRSYAARRLDERRRVIHQVCSAPEPRAPARRRASDCQPDDEVAVAGYVADMTAQLESMARAAGLNMLAYFLAMARAEANAPRGRAGEERDQPLHI
jgi:hypothetical protein